MQQCLYQHFINSMSYRIESDSFGNISVPENAYYAAQTQRSVQNFPICNNNAGHKMPKEVIYAIKLHSEAADRKVHNNDASNT